MDSLVGIKEAQEIQNNFEKESGILEIDPNTMYKVESLGEQHSTLSYENGQKVLEVPNELIPFWTKRGESLYYKDGEFKANV